MAMSFFSIIPAILSTFTSRSQSKATIEAAHINASAQTYSTNQNYTLQVELEKRKLLEADRHRSHQLLLGWLYDLGTTLDNIWDALCSKHDPTKQLTFGDAAAELAWNAERPPRDLAQLEHLLDTDIRRHAKRIARTARIAAGEASIALPQSETHEDHLSKIVNCDENALRRATDNAIFNFQDKHEDFHREMEILIASLNDLISISSNKRPL